MKNKLVFLFAILLVFSFVSAADSVKFFFGKTNYAGNELFDGDLVINYSSADITEEVKGDVLDCGSYSEKTIKLIDLLDKAGIYDGPEKKYVAGESKNSIVINLDNSTNRVFGVYTNDEIDSFKFNIYGSASNVFIDVGNDNLNDWKYTYGFAGWKDIIHSEEYPGNYDLNDIIEYNPNREVCEDFNVSFENLTNSLNLQVNAIVKSVSSGGTLNAKIGSKTCSFSGIGNSWTNVSCNMTLDVNNIDSPYNFEVCLTSGSNSFRIPQKTGTDFHYFSLKDSYNYVDLVEVPVTISDSRLKKVLNDYYDDYCDEEWCVIPLKLSVLNEGNVNIDNLVLGFGGSTSNNFYEVSSENIELNLTEELIPLDLFDDLRTPDVNKKQICTLKISYDSDNYQAKFNMSVGPTVRINVISYYVGKNLPVEFDGSNSGPNITKYSWDFGDGDNATGSKVNHTFDSYGNYTVKLTVKDVNGVESSKEITIYVLSLEEYLDDQFESIIKNVDSSISYLNLQTGDTKEFIELMGYKTKVTQIKTRVSQLKNNFTAIKGSSITNKDAEYSKIANEVSGFSEDVVLKIVKTGSKNVKNLILLTPDDIFGYGSKKNITPGYQDALYDFNKDNVNVDMSMIRFYVTSLAGNDYFALVKKTVSVTGGKNNIIIEDLREYDINEVYTNFSKDIASEVIYNSMSSASMSFSYIVKTEGLSEIKSIVFSDVQVEKEFYCFNQGVNCQSYCGDGACDIFLDFNIDESDVEGDNYCETDCKREVSVWKYVFLFVGFFFLLIYLFLYKGPGSFKHISNRITYWLINRRLFMSEKDRLALHQFVVNAFRKGYNEIQIRQALLKRGWNNKQISSIMENYIKKRY